MVRLTRTSNENWLVLRRRMIAETESFLEDGLRHPQRCFVIPTKEVGKGGWSVAFASVFWSQVLATS